MTVPASNYLIPANFKAELLLLAPATDTLGIVLNDPTPTYNGIYQYSGTPPAWALISTTPPNNQLFGLDVPDLFGLGSTAGLVLGSVVTTTAGSPTIPPGTTLTSVASGTITLNHPVTVTGSTSTTLAFTNGGTVISGVTGTAVNGSQTISNIVFPAPTFQPSAGLYAAIKAEEVHVLAHGIATADSGTTDNAAMINWIAAIIESRGGGKIIFDRPDVAGAWYGIKSPIVLRNNVTFEGTGPDSYIRNYGIKGQGGVEEDSGACFNGNGITQSNYFGINANLSCRINAVAANDHTITLTTTAQVSNFAKGQVVLIFTTDLSGVANSGGEGTWLSGQNYLPFFSRQFRIIDIDAAHGILTLDYTIPVALPGSMSPVVSDGKGTYFGGGSTLPSRLVDRAVVRNLRLSADDQGYGKTFDGGMYEGLIENIWVEGGDTAATTGARALWNGNGLARSVIRNVRGVFREKAIEMATGSHDNICMHFRGTYQTGSGKEATLLLMGEYTANNIIDDVELSAPDFYVDLAVAPAVVTIGPSSGHRIRNVRVTAGLSSASTSGAIRGITMTGQAYQPVSDVRFDNVEIQLKGQQYNFNISAPDTFNPTKVVARDVTFTGDAPTDAGLNLGTNADGDIDNCDFGGPINIYQATSSQVVFTGRIRAKVTGYTFSGAYGSMAAFNLLDLRNMERSGGFGFYSARQFLLHQHGHNTSGSPLTFTYTLPAGQNLTAGDQIVLSAKGTFAGVTVIKHLAIVDNYNGTDNTILAPAPAAGDVGAFSMDALVTIESSTQYSMIACITWATGGTTSTSTVSSQVRRSSGVNLATTDALFKIEGWVNSGTNDITFDVVDMHAKLFGE